MPSFPSLPWVVCFIPSFLSYNDLPCTTLGTARDWRALALTQVRRSKRICMISLGIVLPTSFLSKAGTLSVAAEKFFSVPFVLKKNSADVRMILCE